MKFKDIEGTFTFTDKETHGTGVYSKISARKYVAWSGMVDGPEMTIASINTEVEPWTAESCARVASLDKSITGDCVAAAGSVLGRDAIIANSGMKPEKFNPATVIEQMKARSWRNYTVIEYRGENEDPIESKLGALIGNEDFMETVSWDATGNPIFSGLDETGYGSIRIVLPEGVDEPDYTGMMEAAIPDVYKRRVTLFRAQGFTGMDLYYQLVAAATGSMVRPGSGVNRKPQMHNQKQTNRKNNKARRRSRVYNLKRAA